MANAAAGGSGVRQAATKTGDAIVNNRAKPAAAFVFIQLPEIKGDLRLINKGVGVEMLIIDLSHNSQE
jgi:hypothetical protein